ALDLITVDEAADGIRVGRSVGRQDPDRREPGALAARLGVAGVDERPLEPGVEPARIAEAGQLAPGDHQRLLHPLLGYVRVAEDAARNPEEQVAPGAGKDGERLPVPSLRLLDEIPIHSSALSVVPHGCAVRAYRVTILVRRSNEAPPSLSER